MRIPIFYFEAILTEKTKRMNAEKAAN